MSEPADRLGWRVTNAAHSKPILELAGAMLPNNAPNDMRSKDTRDALARAGVAFYPSKVPDNPDGRRAVMWRSGAPENLLIVGLLITMDHEFAEVRDGAPANIVIPVHDKETNDLLREVKAKDIMVFLKACEDGRAHCNEAGLRVWFKHKKRLGRHPRATRRSASKVVPKFGPPKTDPKMEREIAQAMRPKREHQFGAGKCEKCGGPEIEVSPGAWACPKCDPELTEVEDPATGRKSRAKARSPRSSRPTSASMRSAVGGPLVGEKILVINVDTDEPTQRTIKRIVGKLPGGKWEVVDTRGDSHVINWDAREH